MKRLIVIVGLAALGFAFGSRPEFPLPASRREVKAPEKKSPEEKKLQVMEPETDPKTEIESISEKLKAYENLSYEQFSKEQLEEFHRLNFRRAALIKERIFRKYGGQYGKNL